MRTPRSLSERAHVRDTSTRDRSPRSDAASSTGSAAAPTNVESDRDVLCLTGSTCARVLASSASASANGADDGLFSGLQSLAKKMSSVYVARREYQVTPVIVFGNPGVAVSSSF
jgi:hypothetical protein